MTTTTQPLRKVTLIADNQDTQEIPALHIYRHQDWNTHHAECTCLKCRSEQGHALADCIQDAEFDLSTIIVVEQAIHDGYVF